MHHRLLSIFEVKNLTSLSRTSIYTIRDFPKPVKIQTSPKNQGGSRWLEAEIQEWIASRVAMRDLKNQANKK